MKQQEDEEKKDDEQQRLQQEEDSPPPQASARPQNKETTTTESHARRSFRQSLMKHNSSRSLTLREEQFLQHVLQRGTEVQVQRAQTTLMNDKLFFVVDEEDNGDDDDDDKEKGGSDEEDNDDDDDDDDSSSSLEDDWEKKIEASSSGVGVGSKQRQELLELRRRESHVYNHMWKAHEHIGTSRRDVLSTNSKSTSTAATVTVTQPTTTTAATTTKTATAVTRGNMMRRHHRQGSIRRSSASSIVSRSSNNVSLSSKQQHHHRSVLRSSLCASVSSQQHHPHRVGRSVLQSGIVKSSSRSCSCSSSSNSISTNTTTPTSVVEPKSLPFSSNLEHVQCINNKSLNRANNIKKYSCGLESLKEGQGYEIDDDQDSNQRQQEEEDEDEAIFAAAQVFGQPDKGSLFFRGTSVNNVDQCKGFELQDHNVLVNQDSAADDVDNDQDDDYYYNQNNKFDHQRHPSSSSSSPPSTAALAPLVFMRRASASIYQGEGMEVADLPSVQQQSHHHNNHHHRTRYDPSLPCPKESSKDKDISNSSVFGSGCWFDDDDLVLRLTSTFDETMSYERVSAMFRFNGSSSCIQRTLSDDALILNRQGIMDRMPRSLREMAADIADKDIDQDSKTASTLDYYDSWLSLDDVYAMDHDGEASVASSSTILHDLHILGTSANDQCALPHVLSPPLMASLQAHLPWNKRGENMWLKYSLVRDGASLFSFLKQARAATSSFLAIETVDGEVFGAFTSSAWHKSGSQYFGNGESFLWRMQHSRKEKTSSVSDQCRLESKIDVFPFSHNNQYIQICSNDLLSIGGGTGDTIDAYTVLPDFGNAHDVQEHEYGAGLCLTGDLLKGTSSPCLTYSSPSLSKEHADGSMFEVINLELWSLTPCITLPEAEKLELSQLFLKDNGHFINNL